MMRKLPLAAAVSAMLLTQAQAAEFSNTLFFGDSLTDSGTYAALLPPGTGRFTTNPGPVWSEVMASQFGIALTPANVGGDNYAQGGARITGTPGVGAFPASTATPIATQVSNYLTATGGVADADALYSLWGGANDLFFAIDPANAGTFPTQTAIINYLSQTAGEQVQALATLQAAGARYVIVPTLPDIGASPFGQSLGAAAAASVTSLTRIYNETLMRGLNSNDVTVIPADMFSLLSEIQADPTTYGFINVTTPVCGATASLICLPGVDFTAGQEQTFLFADGVHPTTGAHRIISDYMVSLLQAPAFAEGIARSARYQQRTVLGTVHHQIDAARDLPESGTDLWINGQGGYDSGELEGARSQIGIGVSKRVEPNQTVGFGLHLSLDDSDLPGGELDSFTKSMTLFSAWEHDAFNWSAALAVGAGDYDTERKVRLGPATRTVKGSTSGVQISAEAGAGYNFRQHNLQHGPRLRLAHHLQSIEGFTESSTAGSSTAMKYGSQSHSYSTANIGWQLRMTNGTWQPYGELSWERRIGGDPDAVNVALASLPDNSFSLPVTSEDDSYGEATLGLVTALSERTRMDARVSRLIANDDNEELRLNLSVNIGF
ncbi:autotransporter domain-containing protein [Motiliproteus sediminis]|uniref:autotransporter domain-containing protein n=1 Tax=Motiliproteus sediminis TaxID=1468178 RepID=UPI001AEF412A|nr:autotransporter domain-containing protein [Motiliproteus sediminis]